MSTATRNAVDPDAVRECIREPAEIARVRDRCNGLMRELLDALAESSDAHRTFPKVEDAMGSSGRSDAWP